MVQFSWPSMWAYVSVVSAVEPASHSKSAFMPIAVNGGPVWVHWHGPYRAILSECTRISLCICSSRLCGILCGYPEAVLLRTISAKSVGQVLFQVISQVCTPDWPGRIAHVMHTERTIWITSVICSLRGAPGLHRIFSLWTAIRRAAWGARPHERKLGERSEPRKKWDSVCAGPQSKTPYFGKVVTGEFAPGSVASAMPV